LTGLGEAAAAAVASDLVDAVAYLHGKNIVHLDIKPENVLFRKRPAGAATVLDPHLSRLEFCLTDFGLAAFADTPIRGTRGTRNYWAPEMLAPLLFEPCCDAQFVGRFGPKDVNVHRHCTLQVPRLTDKEEPVGRARVAGANT